MWLEVSRSELSDALDVLPEISSLLSYGQAQLHFDGWHLIAKSPVSCFEVVAVGEWRTVARIPLQFLYGLRGKLPDGERVKIRKDGAKIWFNNVSITAAFQTRIYNDHPLALDAKMIDVLRARTALSEEKLTRSGLNTMVTVAMMELGDIIQVMWAKSGAILEENGFSQQEFRKAILAGIS